MSVLLLWTRSIGIFSLLSYSQAGIAPPAALCPGLGGNGRLPPFLIELLTRKGYPTRSPSCPQTGQQLRSNGHASPRLPVARGFRPVLVLGHTLVTPLPSRTILGPLLGVLSRVLVIRPVPLPLLCPGKSRAILRTQVGVLSRGLTT